MIKKNNHIILVLGVFLIFTSLTHDTWKSYELKKPYQFVNDVDQYYSYLPAAFIHDDLSFNYPNSYWLIKNQNDKLLPKVTMGMGMMYAPFFLIGHTIALNTDHAADGYSAPYSTAIMIGSLFYFIIALIFLIKILDFYFNKWVSAITVLLLFFGTNLMYYVLGAGEMPHSYLFLIYTLLVYYTIKWHKEQKRKQLLLLGFIYGLAVIIRPIELVFMLFFLLYNVYNMESLKDKLILLKKHYINLILAALLFIIPILPQLIYWKIYGGSWLVYSYGESERFFFSNPKIFDFLLGYKKGLLIYSPLLIFSFIGFFFLKEKLKEMRLGVIVFCLVLIFLLSSWWCWWYGGSFGMRAMVQYFVFLAIPLAAFINFIIKKRVFLFATGPIILFFTYYSILYTHKMGSWTLHWDGMNKEAYWFTFMKHGRFNAEDQKQFESMLKSPNYEEAMKGNR